MAEIFVKSDMNRKIGMGEYVKFLMDLQGSGKMYPIF